MGIDKGSLTWGKKHRYNKRHSDPYVFTSANGLYFNSALAKVFYDRNFKFVELGYDSKNNYIVLRPLQDKTHHSYSLTSTGNSTSLQLACRGWISDLEMSLQFKLRKKYYKMELDKRANLYFIDLNAPIDRPKAKAREASNE